MGKLQLKSFFAIFWLTLLSDIVLAQAPNISYSTPVNIYTVGTAITALVPTNTGGAVSTATFSATSVSGPSGMAVSPAGKLYVTQYSSGTITYYSSAGALLGTFGTGFTNPDGIAFDAAGNAYIVDTGSGDVYKITSAGVQSTIITGLTNPFGIAVDASGNVYVTNTGTNRIQKYANTGGAILQTITTSVSSPTDIKFDASGNMYVLDFGTSNITKYTAAGVYSSIFASGFSGPYAMAMGPTGNIYVADSGNNRVLIYNSAGTLLNTISVTDPEGVAVDASGDVFVSSYSGNAIYEYPPLGGYVLTGTLPAGLSFNTTTGTISGTPTASQAATNYTITAYNAFGSSSTVISIACGTSVAWLGFTSTAWATGSNWSTGSAPTATSNVTIGVSAYTGAKKEPLLTTAVSVGSLTFGNNAGSHTLTVTSPGALTIGSTLNIPTAVTPTITGTGSVSIAPAGIVNITGTGVLTLTQPLSFTLMSSSVGSASVGQITSTSIAGTAADSIHVQRYITGGVGYRGYRFMSSPVYSTKVSTNLFYSINYVHDHTFLTGTLGVTNGFDLTGNPTIYLYREDQAPSNASFTGGNFWGISKLNVTSATHANQNYYLNGGATSYSLTAGNGFMLFFRGDRTTVSPYNSSTAPVATTFTATGTLNTGTIIVQDWYTPGVGTIGYTSVTANAAVRGFNLVGNPYASSIDWSTFSNSSSGASIYGLNVNPTIYILNPQTKNYDTYNAATGIATGSASKIIPSGQGFIVQANAPLPTLTFNESSKINAQVSGTNLLMGAPLAQSGYMSYMRLKLVTDSVNNSDIVIGFNSTSTPKFNGNVDSQVFPGTGSDQSLAEISSDSVYTSMKWLPLPKNTNTEVIKLNVTAKTSGSYTLQRTDLKEIAPIYKVWLMDRYKKDSLDIRANTNYAFDIDLADTNSFGSNRFHLVVRQDPALAVHLLNFTGNKVTSGSQIAWVTENEANYTNFTVERSSDGGNNYVVLGGAASSAQGTYSFLDKNPPLAADMYRLKIEDLNGNITYSSIVTLMYGSSPTLVKTGIVVYPNPAATTLNVSIAPGFSGNATAGTNLLSDTPGVSYNIQIANILGTVVIKTTTAQQSWQTNVSALMPGTYVIKVTNNKDNSMVGQATFIKL